MFVFVEDASEPIASSVLSNWLQDSSCPAPTLSRVDDVFGKHSVDSAHQQDVGVPDQGDPELFIGAGQRGELQTPRDFRPSSVMGASGLSTDEIGTLAGIGANYTPYRIDPETYEEPRCAA